MKAMLTAFVAAIIITVGASYALEEVGLSSENVGSGPAVRLD